MTEGIYNQKLVHEYYPEAIMIEAMKIWSLPENKKENLPEYCNSGEYFGQLKKDGFWYEFNKTEHYSYLFSRNESRETGLLTEKIKNVPHIEKALSSIPKDTILIGEIYVPGGTSKDTTRIMGCLPATAIKRQNEEGLIHYYLHDIIAFNGISLLKMPCEKRYQILKKVVENYNLLENDFIELAEIYTENIFEEIGNALARGEEGMVLKKKDAVYSPGKKPAWSAIKCKKVDCVDVVCLGFEDATKEYNGTELETWQYWVIEQESELGKGDWRLYKKINGSPVHIKSPLFRTIPVTKAHYLNWKTAIQIGAYDNENNLKLIGTVSSGLTDEMKKNISERPNDYIGKVIKVQCMEKDSNANTLRHPFFRGFRIDKNAEECLLSEIFN